MASRKRGKAQNETPRCTFIDRAGSFLTEQRFERVRPFSEGVAWVRVEQRWGLLDTSGRTRISPRYASVGDFRGGIAPAAEVDGKTGYVDPSGEWAIPPTWDFALPFEGDHAVVVNGGRAPFESAHEGGQWGVIDRSGRVVLPLDFGHVQHSAGGRFVVNRGGKGSTYAQPGAGTFELLDARGARFVEGEFALARPFRGDLTAVRRASETETRIVDQTGREVGRTPCYVERVARGIVVVQLPAESFDRTIYALAEPTGTVWREGLGMVAIPETGLVVVNDGGVRVRGEARGGTWRFLNEDRTVHSEGSSFTDLSPLSDGLALAAKSRMYGYVDDGCRWVIEPRFEWARPFSSGLAQVRV